MIMASNRFLSIHALRKQHLLVEFSGLKTSCPEGIYLTLSPGDPSIWVGVMFIRKGPYIRAILRFQISFPPTYPALPPLVTFSTDMFHPLITPLTTFLYTTNIEDGGTVSATDDERLPPGGFSLRHGFPNWFGRASKTIAANQKSSRQFVQKPFSSPGGSVSGRESPDSATSGSPNRARSPPNQLQNVSTCEVLEYIRSAFDNPDVLDNVPLEAAGNPGAWHAWRAHRLKLGKTLPSPPLAKEENFEWHDGVSDDEGGTSVPEGYQRLPGGSPLPATTRRPGQWNWEGVWEVRVKKGIEGSLAESTLYGNTAPTDDMIKFLDADDDHLQTMKENMNRSLEVT